MRKPLLNIQKSMWKFSFLTQFLLNELKTVNGNVIGIIDTSWNHAWKRLTHYTMTKSRTSPDDCKFGWRIRL